jgi:hypothetical protein
MEPVVGRILANLASRVSGPMKFRLILQPVMALFLAIRDGLNDAHQGKPAYFWALFTDPPERRSMVKDGWKSIRKLFIMAVALDVIYQAVAIRWVYPGEAVLVAIILAILPYTLVRGVATRLSCRSRKKYCPNKEAGQSR